MRVWVMAKVLMVVRILPSDSDMDLDSLLERVKHGLPAGVVVSDSRREEIGFGLEALVVGFLMPEVDGVGESLERYLTSVDGVGEVDVVSATRV
ncbi:MAG: elongation factor 1-beta [Candidatus Caldarchaeum sp.]